MRGNLVSVRLTEDNAAFVEWGVELSKRRDKTPMTETEVVNLWIQLTREVMEKGLEAMLS